MSLTNELLFLDKENLSYCECCAFLLNIKFQTQYRTGEEYYKDRLLLINPTAESLEQYKSRQIKESFYDNEEELTTDKKEQIRKKIIQHRNIVNAPLLLWNILLNTNTPIKQNLDPKFEKNLNSLEIINLELANVVRELESNDFEFYTSQKGRKTIYPSIDYDDLLKSIDSYYFGMQLHDETTDYQLNPFLWAVYRIVNNDLYPNFRKKYPQAFLMHNAMDGLQEHIQREFNTPKTHAKEIVTQLRNLDTSVQNKE